MNLSRRELAFLLPALAPALAAAQTSGRNDASSQTFRNEDIPPTRSGTLV